MIELFKQHWPWWISGPLIGLMVPFLLLLGNKIFGLSSSLRHICAACFPANIPFFKYNWKREAWNLFFAGGTIIGAFVASYFLSSPEPLYVNPVLVHQLNRYGINDFSNLVPRQLFSFSSLFT